MEKKLEEFISILSEIKKLFSFYENFEKYLSSNSSHKKRKLNNLIKIKREYIDIKNIQRILLQKGIIISLYGAWENFVRTVVIHFAEKKFLHKTKFSEFPREFKIAYFDKYIEFLSKQKNEWKYSNAMHDSISDLHKSINEKLSQINEEIYFKNYANYRINTIAEICSTIGVRDFKNKIISNEKFLKYILNVSPEFRSLQNNENKLRVAFKNLDDFVDLRNNVAHGKKDFQLIHNEMIISFIEYLNMLAEVICDIFKLELFTVESYIYLTLIEKVSDSIGIFKLPVKILKNSKIKVEKGNNSLDELEVISIYNEYEEPVNEGQMNEQVSFKFNKKFKDKWKFFILKDS